jgi:hypothetical protein
MRDARARSASRASKRGRSAASARQVEQRVEVAREAGDAEIDGVPVGARLQLGAERRDRLRERKRVALARRRARAARP